MQCEALQKVINVAEKNPTILLSPMFFQKICAQISIETEKINNQMIFRVNSREDSAVIINTDTQPEFKCFVHECKEGIMIFEVIKVLTNLLTGKKIPPSPYEKIDQTAKYYCSQGISILKIELLEK
jgi:hypothetical protein